MTTASTPAADEEQIRDTRAVQRMRPTPEPSRTGYAPQRTSDADPPDLLARLAVRIMDVALTV